MLAGLPPWRGGTVLVTAFFVAAVLVNESWHTGTAVDGENRGTLDDWG